MSDELTPRQEFNRALLEAQRQFPTIHKGKTARIPTKNDGEYSYKYADLGDVMDAVLPILHKHDLALTQPLVYTENGKVGVGTRIYHSSGHVEDFGELTLPAGNNPQAAGSALTYCRRYAACAALGIVADEDDDGRAASRPPESDYVEDLEEVMPKATNQIKAELAEQVGADRAKLIYADAAEVHGLSPDEAIPKSKIEAMRIEVDARATEAMAE